MDGTRGHALYQIIAMAGITYNPKMKRRHNAHICIRISPKYLAATATASPCDENFRVTEVYMLALSTHCNTACSLHCSSHCVSRLISCHAAHGGFIAQHRRQPLPQRRQLHFIAPL